MAEGVLVRLQWADPERSGLRTLRVAGESLDEVSRVITAAFRPRPAPRSRASDRATVDQPPVVPDINETAEAAAALRLGSNGRRQHAATRLRSDDERQAPAPCAVSAPGETRRPRGEPRPRAQPGELTGPIVWTGTIAAGRFLPGATLVQVQAGRRKVTLRIPGTHCFEAGTVATLQRGHQAGEFFSAEIVDSSGGCTALRLLERLL